MRRQRLRSALFEQQAERPNREQDRNSLRRVQWSSYYHRFFGRVRPGDRVPGGFEPLSLDDATGALNDALPIAKRSWRRHLARRCVSQMMLYGHRPAQHRQRDFDDLAKIAAQPEAGDDDSSTASAKDFLTRWGAREFTPGEIPQVQVDGEMKDAGPDRRMISLPTRLLHDQGAFVVDKEIYLRTKLDTVSKLVNPENWERLGEFFAKTYRENGRNENGAIEAKAAPWHGVLREDFIVSWNGFTTNVFKQRLKVDYTVTPEMARTDYALMYEEDDQIAMNEGFLEVRIVNGLPPGWIAGRMSKKLKFTSSMLNLLAPALLSMLLDSKAGGFNNFLGPSGAKRFSARR